MAIAAAKLGGPGPGEGSTSGQFYDLPKPLLPLPVSSSQLPYPYRNTHHSFTSQAEFALQERAAESSTYLQLQPPPPLPPRIHQTFDPGPFQNFHDQLLLALAQQNPGSTFPTTIPPQPLPHPIFDHHLHSNITSQHSSHLVQPKPELDPHQFSEVDHQLIIQTLGQQQHHLGINFPPARTTSCPQIAAIDQPERLSNSHHQISEHLRQQLPHNSVIHAPTPVKPKPQLFDAECPQQQQLVQAYQQLLQLQQQYQQLISDQFAADQQKQQALSLLHQDMGYLSAVDHAPGINPYSYSTLPTSIMVLERAIYGLLVNSNLNPSVLNSPIDLLQHNQLLPQHYGLISADSRCAVSEPPPSVQPLSNSHFEAQQIAAMRNASSNGSSQNSHEIKASSNLVLPPLNSNSTWPPTGDPFLESLSRNKLGRSYNPGRPLGMLDRHKILQLYQRGLKISHIAKVIGVTHSCVSKIMTRYRRTGSIHPRSAQVSRKRHREVFLSPDMSNNNNYGVQSAGGSCSMALLKEDNMAFRHENFAQMKDNDKGTIDDRRPKINPIGDQRSNCDGMPQFWSSKREEMSERNGHQNASSYGMSCHGMTSEVSMMVSGGSATTSPSSSVKSRGNSPVEQQQRIGGNNGDGNQTTAPSIADLLSATKFCSVTRLLN